MIFELNLDRFPIFSDFGFLKSIVGDKCEGKFSHILKMSDFEGNPRYDIKIEEDGEDTDYTMSTYFKLFFSNILPDYNDEHQVNQNLGTIIGNGGKITYYAPSIALNENQFPSLFIGGKDTKLGVEPYEVPLVYSSSLKSYNLPIDGMVSPTIDEDEVKTTDSKYKVAYYAFGRLFGEDDDLEKHVFRIKIIIPIDKQDKTNSKAIKLLQSRWLQQKLNFKDVLGTIGGRSGFTAKSNYIFSPFFENGLLSSFVFKVIGVQKVIRQKNDGSGEFRQLDVFIDTSDFPSWGVVVIDFSTKPAGSTIAPLNEVVCLQMDYGSDSKKLTRMGQAYKQATEKQPDTDEPLFPLPTVENPWYLSFTAPPKKKNNNPDWVICTDFVLPSVLERFEACKDVGYINPTALSKLQERITDLAALEAVDVSSVEVDSSEEMIG